MESRTKNSLLSAAVVLCLGAIGGLGYYTWQLHQKVDALQTSQSQTLSSPLGPIPKILHQKNWNPWSNSWDPSGQLAEMQKRMNAMMRQLMPGNPTFNQQGFGFSNSPRITMKQTPKQYIFDVSVPKNDNFDLNTSLNHNTLTISGKVKTKADHSGSDGSSQSVATSRFSQSVTLADPVEKSGMTIDRKGKTIVITIPKDTG